MPQYPLFIVDSAGDMQLLETPSGLACLEQVDVEAGEYSGWDVCGRRVRLLWQQGSGVQAQLVEERQRPDELREAILNHATLHTPGRATSDLGLSNDPVEMFARVEKSILESRPGVLKRAKRLFTRS